MEILEAARQLGGGSSPLVFASRGDKPIGITRLPRILQSVKVNAVPHGFRSLFRDWAAEETNHPRDAIEAALKRCSPQLETVRLILRQQQSSPPPVCRSLTGVRPDLAEITVPAPTLAAYDVLLEGRR